MTAVGVTALCIQVIVQMLKKQSASCDSLLMWRLFCVGEQNFRKIPPEGKSGMPSWLHNSCVRKKSLTTWSMSAIPDCVYVRESEFEICRIYT